MGTVLYEVEFGSEVMRTHREKIFYMNHIMVKLKIFLFKNSSNIFTFQNKKIYIFIIENKIIFVSKIFFVCFQKIIFLIQKENNFDLNKLYFSLNSNRFLLTQFKFL